MGPLHTTYAGIQQYVDHYKCGAFFDTRIAVAHTSPRYPVDREPTCCADEAAMKLAQQQHDKDCARWTSLVRELNRTPHPLVLTLLEHGIAPVTPVALALECPHESIKQPGAVAFTLNEEKLLADKQTVLGLGKYLARHWPHLPSSVLRDYMAYYNATTVDTFKIVQTTWEMVCAVEMGPPSCMKSRCGASRLSGVAVPRGFGDTCEEWYRATPTQREGLLEPVWAYHPYAVYAPELGWGMALRIVGGGIVGRAVVQVDKKRWVRTFRQDPDNEDGYSYADTVLEAWLAGEGYKRLIGWEGFRVKRLEHRDGGTLMPYLDGAAQHADIDYDELVICEGGDVECINTDGSVDDNASRVMCARCEDYVDEDEIDTAYMGDSREVSCVCNHCLESDFTEVRGLRPYGASAPLYYYVSESQAIEVDGDYYDAEYRPDYIVCLHDGEYTHMDNAVWIEEEDEYYHVDDPAVVWVDGEGHMLRTSDRVCRTADTGQWMLKEDAYEGPDGTWYEDEEARDYVQAEANGQTLIEGVQ